MPKLKRAIKPIPEFASEAAEQKFWATHDATEYFDWPTRVVAFPNLEALDDADLDAPARDLAQ